MKMKRIAKLVCIALLLTMVFSTTAFAAGTGDVVEKLKEHGRLHPNRLKQ